MTKHIVILGASFAGIQAAHHILKSLPSDYKVILVSPSTHVYWNIAAPRAVTAPGLLQNDQILLPFAQYFESYPESQFEFVQGKAVALKPESNALIIKTIDDSHPEGLSEQEIVYEHIVVATGSNSHGDWPFKSQAPYSKTLEDIKRAQGVIADAGSIVISGAGPTGVETAGEIKSHFPDKSVTIISTGATTLPMMKANVGTTADKTLKKLGVEIKANTKVVREQPDASGKGTVLELDNGETITTDVHIPAHITRPNNDFLPKELLNEHGWLVIDSMFKSPKFPNIWGLGDITDYGVRKSMVIKGAAPPLAANLVAAINGTEMKPHEWGKDMGAIVPIGPKFGRGTGSLFGWKVPGIFAWLLKGRDMMASMAPSVVKKP